jgi:methylmalonyl-CoA/ethylmalonyl-CoA epimerase
MKVDHVTAIVADGTGAAAALARLLGVGPANFLELPGMAISTFAIDGVELHVNAPTGDGPVREHLRARGEGYHHVALSTDDLDAEIARIEALGFRLLGAPVETAPGLREVFVDPKTAGGLLIQLVERRDSMGARAFDGDAIDALARSAVD